MNHRFPNNPLPAGVDELSQSCHNIGCKVKRILRRGKLPQYEVAGSIFNTEPTCNGRNKSDIRFHDFDLPDFLDDEIFIMQTCKYCGIKRKLYKSKVSVFFHPDNGKALERDPGCPPGEMQVRKSQSSKGIGKPKPAVLDEKAVIRKVEVRHRIKANQYTSPGKLVITPPPVIPSPETVTALDNSIAHLGLMTTKKKEVEPDWFDLMIKVLSGGAGSKLVLEVIDSNMVAITLRNYPKISTTPVTNFEARVTKEFLYDISERKLVKLLLEKLRPIEDTDKPINL